MNRSEINQQAPKISDEEMGTLLSSVGNSEAKALLYTVMALEPASVYSPKKMMEAVCQAQGIDIVGDLPPNYECWRIYKGTLKDYSKGLFQQNGLIKKVRGGYTLVPERLNRCLAFCGIQLQDAKQQDTALSTTWGESGSCSPPYEITTSDGALLQTRLRAPLILYRVYQKVLSMNLPVSATDLTVAIGCGRRDEGKIANHLNRLDKAGILIFDSGTDNDPTLFYFPKNASVVRERHMRHSTFRGEEAISSRVYRVVKSQPGEFWTTERVKEALVAEDPNLIAHSGLKGTIEADLYELSRARYIIKNQRYPGEANSIVDITESQRERLKKIIDLLKSLQDGDLETIGRGRELAREFAHTPELARKALDRARLVSNRSTT